MLSELSALAAKQNPQLESQIISKRLSELQLKQIKAGRYPVISVNTAYNIRETQSSSLCYNQIQMVKLWL
jgi:outer membrane protein TolC